jgi:cyanate permease
MVGAAIAATAAGLVRDTTGEYTLAWFGAAGLCLVAAVVSAAVTRTPVAQKVE